MQGGVSVLGGDCGALGPLAETEHGGTNVLFTHTGLAEEQSLFELGSVAHTWSTTLDRLKELAESGSAQPALE